jgi:hypothetical protein
MDLHLFPVLCRVINSGFEKPAVQLIFDKNQTNIITSKHRQRTIAYTRNAEGGNFSRRLGEIVSVQCAQAWGTEGLTLANDICFLPQFQKTLTRLFPAHVLRTMGILMHAAALPSKAHQAARTLNHKRCSLLHCSSCKEILNQQKISTTLLITQQHTGEKRREQQGRVSRPNINTESALFFWRGQGGEFGNGSKIAGSG